MAYIITSDEIKTNVSGIARDASARDNMDMAAQCVAHEISEAEFNNLKNHTKRVSSHDGTNFVYEDMTTEFLDENDLKAYLVINSKAIAQIIEKYPDHPDMAIWTTYKNLIDNYDTSTITFPLNTSWEKYCEDNSIDYFHLLELP